MLPSLQNGDTLLTPNNRSVDGILREFANHKQSGAQPASAWLRPSVFAIDVYLQQLWQKAAAQCISPFSGIDLLDRFNEQQLWIQVLQSSYDSYPLLNIEEAANSVAKSYQLFKQWDAADQADIERYTAAVDFQVFLQWSSQFEALCTRRKLISLSDASRLITSNIGKLRGLLPQQLVLVNFNQPPPLYSKLFDALATACRIDWHRYSNEQQNLKTALLAKPGRRTKYQDSATEINACIAWCLQKVRENEQAHIGIVIDRGRTLEPLIEEAVFKLNQGRGVRNLHTTTLLNRYQSNETLADLPSINFALAILALNNELVDSERFCKVLQSATCIAADLESQARIALEVYLRKSVEAQLRLSHLRGIMQQKNKDHSCPVLAEALLQFSEAARHEKPRQALRHWLHLFNRQLQILGWPGSGDGNLDNDVARQWQQGLGRLSASSDLLGKMSLATALHKLSSYLRQSNSNLRFDGRLQISLVDIEEAQDFEFDSAWILAVDDRNWPPPVKPVSFLPYSLQKQLSMPNCSHQQQLETSLSQLIRLRSNTKEELLISHHCLEEDLSIRASALLNEIEFVNTQDEQLADKPAPLMTKPLEILQEQLHIPLSGEEQIRGGSGLLIKQSNCPFSAFASNRLKVSRLGEFSAGLNPIARGKALHLALKKLGDALENSDKLQRLSAPETETLIHSSLVPAINSLRAKYPETMSPAFTELEQIRLANLLHGFLELEKARSPFTIQATEEKLNWSHSRLSLSFIIDRIDQIEDGSLLLIDYKTGLKSNFGWFDDRPDDLQLPLYQIALANNQDQAISATLICQINAQKTALFGTTDLDTIHPQTKPLSKLRGFSGNWVELQARWNKVIHSLVDEFESGLVSVAPARGRLTCQYCEFPALCRINEFGQRQLSATDEEP